MCASLSPVPLFSPFRRSRSFSSPLRANVTPTGLLEYYIHVLWWPGHKAVFVAHHRIRYPRYAVNIAPPGWLISYIYDFSTFLSPFGNYPDGWRMISRLHSYTTVKSCVFLLSNLVRTRSKIYATGWINRRRRCSILFLMVDFFLRSTIFKFRNEGTRSNDLISI